MILLLEYYSRYLLLILSCIHTADRGDIILQIDEKQIKSSRDIFESIGFEVGKELTFKILRTQSGGTASQSRGWKLFSDRSVGSDNDIIHIQVKSAPEIR